MSDIDDILERHQFTQDDAAGLSPAAAPAPARVAGAVDARRRARRGTPRAASGSDAGAAAAVEVPSRGGSMRSVATPGEPEGADHRNAADIEVRVIEQHQKDDYIRFRLDHADSALANALRRICISEVPILAIDLVEVYSNESVLHDEMLLHRIGLMPIQTYIDRELPTGQKQRVNICDELVSPRDCECPQVCKRCSITFEIDLECQSQRMSVTTHHVVNKSSPGDIGYGVEPVHMPNSHDHYPIVLVELSKHQKLKLKCVARKGVGKEHAKWNPTCTIAMQFVPDIVLNEQAFNELAPKDKERWVHYCPRRVYGYDKATNRVGITKENKDNCFFCMECVAVSDDPFHNFKGKNQLASVRRAQDEHGRYDYFFRIETTGCMTPAECFLEAIKVLKEKVEKSRAGFEKILRKPNAEGQTREAEIHRGDAAQHAAWHRGSASGEPSLRSATSMDHSASRDWSVPYASREPAREPSERDSTHAIPWA